jgi:hypothetical protein
VPPPAPWEAGYDWRDLLQKLNLLPPSGATDLEIHVGTWWATRIGILLAVLCGVFFAVWASQYTTPATKFIELLGGAAILSGVGLRLERKFEQFGRVVFAGGLALGYFSMWAGYAIPAVKVIDSAPVAAFLMFLAAAGVIACALWKNSQSIGTLAVFLGYVACLFSVHAGLSGTSLVAAFVLGAGSTVLLLWKAWPRPIQFAVPLSYLLYAAVYVLVWARVESSTGFAGCMIPLFAYLGLFWVADFLSLSRAAAMSGIERKAVQLCNTSGAVVLGFLVTATLFPDRLSAFYFLLGAALLAGSLAYYLTGRRDVLMQTFFVKGTTLVTLGLATEFGARTRWVTLGIQSFLLLLSARRSRLVIVELAMYLTWLVSFGFFAHYTLGMSPAGREAGIWTTNGIVSVAYLLFSAYLFCLVSRWLEKGGGVSGERGIGSVGLGVMEMYRDTLFTVCGLVIAGGGVLVASTYFRAEYIPMGAIALAVLFAGVAGLGRHWVPLIPAVVTIVLAHVRVWSYPVPLDLAEYAVSPFLGNVAAVVVATVATAVLFQRTLGSKPGHPSFAPTAGEGILHVLWMVAVIVAGYKLLSIENLFLLAVVMTVIVTVVAERFPSRILGDLAGLPMYLAFLGWLIAGTAADGRLGRSGHESLLWLATVAAFAVAARSAPVGEEKRRFVLWEPGAFSWQMTALATALGWYTLAAVFDAGDLMLALAVAGVAVLPLLRWPGLRPAAGAGGVYLLLAHVTFYLLVTARTGGLSGGTLPHPLGGEPWTAAAARPEFLWFALIAGALTVAWPVLVRFLSPALERPVRDFLDGAAGAAALGLLFVLFLTREGALENYVTVFWGLSSVSVFLVGLVTRSKPLRIVGLVGLALCIPRVFLVDIRSALHRIFAFGALGMVLLAIGFLYSKYRDTIQHLDEAK